MIIHADSDKWPSGQKWNIENKCDRFYGQRIGFLCLLCSSSWSKSLQGQDSQSYRRIWKQTCVLLRTLDPGQNLVSSPSCMNLVHHFSLQKYSLCQRREKNFLAGPAFKITHYLHKKPSCNPRTTLYLFIKKSLIVLVTRSVFICMLSVFSICI